MDAVARSSRRKRPLASLEDSADDESGSDGTCFYDPEEIEDNAPISKLCSEQEAQQRGKAQQRVAEVQLVGAREIGVQTPPCHGLCSLEVHKWITRRAEQVAAFKDVDTMASFLQLSKERRLDAYDERAVQMLFRLYDGPEIPLRAGKRDQNGFTDAATTSVCSESVASAAPDRFARDVACSRHLAKLVGEDEEFILDLSLQFMDLFDVYRQSADYAVNDGTPGGITSVGVTLSSAVELHCRRLSPSSSSSGEPPEVPRYNLISIVPDDSMEYTFPKRRYMMPPPP